MVGTSTSAGPVCRTLFENRRWGSWRVAYDVEVWFDETVLLHAPFWFLLLKLIVAQGIDGVAHPELSACYIPSSTRARKPYPYCAQSRPIVLLLLCKGAAAARDPWEASKAPVESSRASARSLSRFRLTSAMERPGKVSLE